MGIVMSIGLMGCAGEPGAAASLPDVAGPTGPEAVVQAVFDVAAGRRPAAELALLCDPTGTPDIDVRRICEQAADFDPQGSFAGFFAEGILDGDARVEGGEAWVPIRLGPGAHRRDTLHLMLVGQKWYLRNFQHDPF